MIRVYPIPPVLTDNPYLDLLYTPMAGWPEVEVRRMRPLRRSLFALLTAPAPRLSSTVVHLHFFDEICQRPSRVGTAVRTAAFIALVRLLRWRGVRLVWSAHNLMPHEAYHSDLAERLYRQVVALSDAVIAFSSPAADDLVARYGPPRYLAVIPHGHFIGQRGPKQAQAKARVRLNLPADAFIYLCLGAWRPYKGLEDAIAAFAQLIDNRRRTTDDRASSLLVIAGQPKVPGYAALLQTMAERVSGVRLIPGRVADEAMASYWGAADVAVFAYRQLTNSGALIEAMSYEVPVIAPDVSAVRELVREGETGFLFVPGDIASLRAAMERAQAHPDLPALGRAALDRVRRADWEEIAARTLEVYRTVVSDRKSESKLTTSGGLAVLAVKAGSAAERQPKAEL